MRNERGPEIIVSPEGVVGSLVLDSEATAKKAEREAKALLAEAEREILAANLLRYTQKKQIKVDEGIPE